MGNSLGMYFANIDGGGSFGWEQKGNEEKSDKDPKKEKTGPNFWQRMGGFFSSLFGSDKGAGISSFLVGAEVSRVVQVGEAISITAESFYASAGILATRSLWGLPLMLNGDSGFTANSKPITGAIDIPISAEISKGDNNRNGILLYRGVSSFSHTETQAIMYNEALFGIAIPNGLRPGETAHWNMDDHAGGDNYSAFTSWTSDPTVARDFATSYGTAPGVILSKRFKVGVNAIPNISTNAQKMQEREWLILGPVIRANVQHVKP